MSTLRTHTASSRIDASHRRFMYIVHAIMVVLCAAIVLPFIMIVMASFSDETSLIRHGYGLWPETFSLEAYQLVARNSEQLVQSYVITIVSTVAGTILGLWLMTTMGYALSRRDFHFRNGFSFYIFFTMLFRGGLVPSYILIASWLGMYNTVYALFVPALVNAFYILLLKGFLKSIPDVIYESAKLDGAGEMQIFLRIVIPLSTPAIATVGLLLALQFWNDWFASLLFTDRNHLLTLQAMLYRMLNSIQFLSKSQMVSAGSGVLPQASFRMAICVLAVGPLMFVFPFFQRFFARGLTIGAVKG